MKMDYSVKMLPIYSVLLLFISYINIAFYYGHFGVDISNYIDLTELFLISLPVFETILYPMLFILLPLILALIVAFFGFSIQSPNKMIREVIDEKRKQVTNIEPDRISDDEIFLKVKDQMGFHLADKISELNKLRSIPSERWTFCKKMVSLLAIVIITAYMIAKSIFYLTEQIEFIKNHTKEFIDTPGQVIFLLFVFTIVSVFLFFQLFSPKMLWKMIFSKMISEQGLPILIFGIYMVVGLLLNYSKIQKLTYTNQTDIYNVYLKGERIATDSHNNKFIGRTKDFLFILTKNRVKIVKIADADSIIFTKPVLKN